MNALRRRKELSDICDTELQLREEVKILGKNFENSNFIFHCFSRSFFLYSFQEAKRRQRETSDRLARLEKEREEKHRCDGCSSDFKPGRGNGKKDHDQN